ncbi:MAG: type IV pilin N-terminal domain-containing protein [Candidatus Methanoperedens sp.]|nr:type IV pilin N-terminal domain-containing protein [Candidatus Methanoperedens sp.]MCZ7371553.1 type IV pilin N-terminal domain-containing protein [Candidatus Methanoperedens sp.]
MRELSGCETAVSPVIGVSLLVGLTVIMASIIALSVLSVSGLYPSKIPPEARILATEAKGDLDTLYKNCIVLRHRGGDFLYENNTRIIIAGKGYTYSGSDPYLSAKDMVVTYRDISGDNYGGVDGNNTGEIVDGVSWDAGESISLCGSDGRNIGSPLENVDQGNTVDSKWKLEAGSTVSITVVDTQTNQIIAFSQLVVKPG